MTIKQLQYFLRIVELKSFSKAAAYLHVAQPALGLQIRKLEDELGVKLLNRHSRGVTPTEAGILLGEHAVVILRQVERARTSVTDLTGPPRGRIAVGVTATVNLVLATRLVDRCRETLPGVSLSIVEAMSEDLMEWVEGDRLDMAFTYNPSAVPGLVCEPLLTEELCLVGPGGDPRMDRGSTTFAELSRLPMVLPSRPHGLRSLVDEAAHARNEELNITLEVDSVAAIKELVAETGGYTVLPLGAVQRDVESGRLAACPIRAPRLTRTMYLAHSSKRPASNAAGAVRELIRALVRDGMDSGLGAWRSPDGAPAAGKGRSAVPAKGAG